MTPTAHNPDIEVARACAPSLARTGGMLIGISSPYRRAGLLYQRFKDHYERDDDDILVVRGGTISVFNPTIAQAVIDKQLLADPKAPVRNGRQNSVQIFPRCLMMPSSKTQLTMHDR